MARVRAILRNLVIAFTALCSLSQAPAATEIAGEFRQGLIWVKVTVRGQPAPLDFLLDSGAGSSVLDLGRARQMGLKLGARQAVQGVGGRDQGYRIDEFTGQVGGMDLTRKLLALDLSAVSRACGRRIDGLVGADFFRNQIVQIDYGRQKVRLLERAEFRAGVGEALPLARRGDALCVRVAVEGNAPAWMRVDTGCDAALQWVATGARAGRRSDTSIGVTTGSAGTALTRVQLGATCLVGVKTSIRPEPLFAGEAGLLGNGVLSKFTVTIDAGGKQLLLARR
jgi:predicted aspartyl protease